MQTIQNMINVLHVIDKLSMDGANPSSCAQLFTQWHAQHDARRFRMMVASLRRKDAAGEFLQQRGVEVFYIDKGKFSPANVHAIGALIDKHEAHLVHLHGYSSANFGRLAAQRKGIPAVMHEHAILKVLPHQYLADWLLRKKTGVAVAVSNAVADFLRRGRCVPREKIQVIWNGIDLRAFRRPDRKKAEAFRGRFAAPPQKLIGTITRLREEKGNRYFLQAAHEVLQNDPGVRFVLAGEGPERARLERLAAQLGIQDRVHFAGFVKDVPEALAAFDIVVIPSLREGFGLALAEALAAAKPVIATRVGGMVEMVEHEKHALMIPPADGRALAQAILQLLKQPALAQSLAEAACEHSESFSIAKNVAALEALYERLARNEKDRFAAREISNSAWAELSN